MPIKQPAWNERLGMYINGFDASLVNHLLYYFFLPFTGGDLKKNVSIWVNYKGNKCRYKSRCSGNKRNRIDKYGLPPTRLRRYVRVTSPVCRTFLLSLHVDRLNDSERNEVSILLFFFTSRGRTMVQMVGMVGVWERLYAHEEEIVRRSATQPRWTILPRQGHQRGELHRRHVQR